MENIEYVAWSLYTGPAGISPVIDDPNCPWVVGAWNGINRDTTPQQSQSPPAKPEAWFYGPLKAVLSKNYLPT